MRANGMRLKNNFQMRLRGGYNVVLLPELLKGTL